MANQEKLKLGSTQGNKLIAELPEKRENINASVQFRNGIMESQTRVNYKSEFDRLQGFKHIVGLQPNVKQRMK